MPEVGIGFFPDVGGIYALPRLPGRTGMYLAVTGDRIGLADAAALGLVTHAVASEAMDRIREDLVGGRPVEEALAAAVVDPGRSPLDEHRSLIDDCFSGRDVEDMLRRLDDRAGSSDFAARTAAAMRTKSPTSLSIAFEQMRRGGALDFDEAMRTDFRVVSRISEGHDFYEGVRALLIDKDGRPAWKPESLAAIDPAVILQHFADLGPNELKVV
jgi:enoyl-CoA hydratase